MKLSACTHWREGRCPCPANFFGELFGFRPVLLRSTAKDDSFALVLMCLLSVTLLFLTHLVFRWPRWIPRRCRAGEVVDACFGVISCCRALHEQGSPTSVGPGYKDHDQQRERRFSVQSDRGLVSGIGNPPKPLRLCRCLRPAHADSVSDVSGTLVSALGEA